MEMISDEPKTIFIPQGHVMKVLPDTVPTFPAQSYPVFH